MVDPLKEIEVLARRARGGQAPAVNVFGRVMAAVRGVVPAPEDSSLKWVAAVSAVAAAVAIIALVPVYRDFSDPMVAIMLNISWGLL